MIQLAARLWTHYSHINWALADQTMVSGVNFLTGILLSRYLGLEEFGRFTLAWMAVLFVNSLQHAAIISPMMSIGPKQPEAEAPAYYGAIVVQQIVFSRVSRDLKRSMVFRIVIDYDGSYMFQSSAKLELLTKQTGFEILLSLNPQVDCGVPDNLVHKRDVDYEEALTPVRERLFDLAYKVANKAGI